ncbi:MAG: hypothetical protein V4702_01445 [Patescibacteria group bacterium]
MTFIYILIIVFTNLGFSWLAFIVILFIDSTLWNRRRKQLEGKIERGEAEQHEVDEYLEEYDGDEDIVNQSKD